MASFTSALSLFVLVLVSGCFTLPIVNQQFDNDVTTEKVVSLRLVSDDDTTDMTHMNFEMSTAADSTFAKDASRAPRMIDDVATMESFTFSSTTERSFHNKRESDDLTVTTFEPTSQGFEHVPREFIINNENESAPIKRSFDDLIFTTSESVTKDKLFKTHGERDMPLELTTSFMPSFTSTSSVFAPQFYTSEPSTSTSTSTSTPSSTSTSTSSSSSTSTSTSTKKYTGLLTDDSAPSTDDFEREHVKPIKSQETDSFTESTPSRRPKVEPEEDSKDLHVGIAVFDQEALKNVINVPNDVMYLDDKSDVITAASKLFPVTMDNEVENTKLPQGEESSHNEEKKSDN